MAAHLGSIPGLQAGYEHPYVDADVQVGGWLGKDVRVFEQRPHPSRLAQCGGVGSFVEALDESSAGGFW